MLLSPEPTATFAQYLGDGAVVVIVFAKGWMDHRGGRRRDTSLSTRLNDLKQAIAEVRAFVVGPDGENGIRSDVREVKARVISLENRERERLERGAQAPRDFSLNPPSRSNVP
jgi:hypothetical protein